MLQKVELPVVFLVIVVLFSRCGPSGPNGNQNALSTPSPPITPCPTSSPEASRKIAITFPCDGAKVAPRNFIEGVVSDTSVSVWVVIHPMETADLWVQSSVTVREGGKWKVLCYFGEPGMHAGKHYEVMAIANPKEKLREGEVLPNWPEAQSKSQVIEVVRE